eukprot:1392250-Amorphochlora_amoeboformis.AAC.2
MLRKTDFGLPGWGFKLVFSAPFHSLLLNNFPEDFRKGEREQWGKTADGGHVGKHLDAVATLDVTD